jgi:hypothetical protein
MGLCVLISTLPPFLLYSVFGKSLCTYKGVGSDVHERLYPFNFVRKNVLQICVRKIAVHL